MNYTDIIKDVKAGKYAPLYFLQGEEAWFIDQVATAIEEHVLSPEQKDFNFTVLYGKETDHRQILDASQRAPMMSPLQVVMVREAQHVKDLDKLEHYFAKPLSSTVLVFSFKGKKLDKRKKVSKVIEKNSVMLTTERIRDHKVPDWINKYAQSKGYPISAKATILLTEYLGNDLGRHVTELDKLMLNVKEGTEITPALIEEYVGISREYNVFELQNAVGKKDILQANKILKYMALNPKTGPMVLILGTFYGFFSKILKIHFSPSKDESSLKSTLGVHPFFVKDYIKAARNYTLQATEDALGTLLEYDLKLKGVGNTSVKEKDLLREMVYKLMHN